MSNAAAAQGGRRRESRQSILRLQAGAETQPNNMPGGAGTRLQATLHTCGRSFAAFSGATQSGGWLQPRPPHLEGPGQPRSDVEVEVHAVVNSAALPARSNAIQEWPGSISVPLLRRNELRGATGPLAAADDRQVTERAATAAAAVVQGTGQGFTTICELALRSLLLTLESKKRSKSSRRAREDRGSEPSNNASGTDATSAKTVKYGSERGVQPHSLGDFPADIPAESVEAWPFVCAVGSS